MIEWFWVTESLFKPINELSLDETINRTRKTEYWWFINFHIIFVRPGSIIFFLLNSCKQMLGKRAKHFFVILPKIFFNTKKIETWFRRLRIVIFFSVRVWVPLCTSKRPIAFLSVNKHDVKRQPFVEKSFWHSMSHYHFDWMVPTIFPLQFSFVIWYLFVSFLCIYVCQSKQSGTINRLRNEYGGFGFAIEKGFKWSKKPMATRQACNKHWSKQFE